MMALQARHHVVDACDEGVHALAPVQVVACQVVGDWTQSGQGAGLVVGDPGVEGRGQGVEAVLVGGRAADQQAAAAVGVKLVMAAAVQVVVAGPADQDVVAAAAVEVIVAVSTDDERVDVNVLIDPYPIVAGAGEDYNPRYGGGVEIG